MSKFLWGAATAAHQVEGAYNEDGKVLNIWDMCEGHVAQNKDGKVACDHYHRYKEDVALMKKIGLNSYRFSVAWSRVIVDEKGTVNPKGLKFYLDLIDELEKNGIEPLCTLFHWDLPLWAYNKGGWKSEQIQEWFVHYVDVVTKAFAKKVRYYFTFNEPQNFVGSGYLFGGHAPFEKNDQDVICRIVRNVLLCHGKAVQVIRHNSPDAKIGMAVSTAIWTPDGNTTEEIEKAKQHSFDDKAGVFSTAWWCDTAVLGMIPKGLTGVVSKEDMAVIAQPLDFFAFNCYSSNNYTMYANPPRYHPVPGFPRTSIGWSVTPEVLYWAPKFYYERYHLPILISENGMSNCDWVMEDGKVHDPQRIDYMSRYLKEMKRAQKDGIPILGYQHWTLMDNFEWAEGYERRFGLIYVDFKTQERTLKDSAYFYSEVISQDGENL